AAHRRGALPAPGRVSVSRAPLSADAVSLLVVEGLSKRFGGLQAVKDLSFSVDEGGVVGLIGPNGAGKTTVFGLVSGFIAPDAGDVRLRGRSIVGARPHEICALGLA